MTSKSPDQNLLEAHSLNRWAAKNPDQLLSISLTFRGSVEAAKLLGVIKTPPPQWLIGLREDLVSRNDRDF